MIAVLGGGIAGISAGYHIGLQGEDYCVFEQNATWGGLLDNFYVGEFLFDYCVHLSFAKSEYVQNLFAKSTDFITHKPVSTNYYKNFWLKHPAQNNLFNLPPEEKVKIILDFIDNQHKTQENGPVVNYEDWLRLQYGNYFAENFPIRYTRKYWTREAKDLTTDWIGNRMTKPSMADVLLGAFTADTPHAYYVTEMRYPVQGGYKSFIRFMADNCRIALNKKAISIDLKAQAITFADGSSQHYEKLISTLPLPELIKIIKDVPCPVMEAAAKLSCTSVGLVSLGFKRPDVAKDLWFYIYDEDILPSRAYSPSLKSPANAPVQGSSLQFETYFSKFKPLPFQGVDLVEHVIQKGKKMNLFTPEDVAVADYKSVAYGNVIFDFNYKNAKGLVQNYLDGQEIGYAGRFGEWGYLWSDQSLLSGKKCAENIIKIKN